MSKYKSFSMAFLLVIQLLSYARADSTAIKPADNNALPLDELRIFAEVFGRIKKDYVEPVDDRELLRYAIRGMLNGLDPHSSYLDEDAFAELREGTSGEFGGLGIEVSMEDGVVKVISPIDDTPASRAGIKSGDYIVKLDGKPVKGMSLNDAIKIMRGKPGEEIVLTIIRDSTSPFEVTVKRDVIKSVSVKNKYYDNGIGYIRVSSFQSHSTADMLDAISSLKEKSGGKLKGLVLDLRNNPGGVLNGAVGVSDAFLTDGIIVYTEGRSSDSRLQFKAAPDDVLDGAPIVVLVNGGSASASEIVAGALQDHKRAVIMGRPTFGKGSVQTILPVNNKIAVKLTTALYYTPNGRSIQADGIKPDIIIEKVKVTAKKKTIKQLKEKDLSGHLENAEAKMKNKKNKEDDDNKPLVEKDFELNEAINLLKGLIILNRDAV